MRSRRPGFDALPRAGSRPWALALALATTTTIAGSATAQEPKRDAAAAEVLFAEGKRLMEQKKLSEACPKFEESHRLDPGVGALLNLAACQEQRGKIASAWGHYRDAEQQLRREADLRRAEFARGRAAALEPRLPKLVVTVAAQPEGFSLARDGVVLSAASFGSELPVDPGPHDLVASAPGHVTRSTRVGAEERQVTRVTVERLDPGPRPPAEIIGPVPEASRPPEEEATSDTGDTQRVVGIVVGASGLASLAVGAIFVGLTASSTSTADEGCPTPTTCDADGFAAVEDARTTALVADVTLIGGVALAAAGVVLHLTAPRDAGAATAGPSVALSPAPGGFLARGTF